jgi:hypothetical protein
MIIFNDDPLKGGSRNHILYRFQWGQSEYPYLRRRGKCKDSRLNNFVGEWGAILEKPCSPPWTRAATFRKLDTLTRASASRIYALATTTKPPLVTALRTRAASN